MPRAATPAVPADAPDDAPRSVGFLGPAGTFTEEALFTEADYAAADMVPLPTIEDVLEAVTAGRVSVGFLPIENAIEGTVNATADSLIFDSELRIQREVVIGIHLNLVAGPDTALTDVRRLLSFPVATAQCRHYLAEHLRAVEIIPTNSTAEAAQRLSEDPHRDTAALSPRLAAELYGLTVIAEAVEDHPDNQTRFVAVAARGVPAPTGHDKTSIVCFQREDHPGSLHAILSEFSARGINLTKLESRPTKRALGDYCFLIDLEGHIGDEVVADCLRVLRAELADVKLLGSYPAAGAHGPALRRQARQAWQEADAWVADLRREILPGP